jgi:protein-tyrosine-phosphatase
VQPDNSDIEDPVGCPAEIYEQCALQIEDALRRRVRELKFE